VSYLQLRWEWKNAVAEPLKLAAETVANLTAHATAYLDENEEDESDDAMMQHSDCDDDDMQLDDSAAAAAADAQGDAPEPGATPLLMVSSEKYSLELTLSANSSSSCCTVEHC
jgi:hypothetical protein